MLCGLVQMTSSDDPAANLVAASAAVREAAQAGADIAMTPEVTNCLSNSRRHQNDVLRPEAEDPVLAGLREVAAAEGIWVLIGSLALKTDDPDGRFANRSFLIDPQGEVVAKYDKIHMFDVDLSEEETYRESDGYRPGDRAVVAETPLGRIGMTICYDLRFPHLFRGLARCGAEILTVPAAFARPTGAAHWEVLLRARAIETGCFVLAPAQTGTHPASAGKIRKTWGHSLAVSPWGEVLLNMGNLPGVGLVEIDIAYAAGARSRVPAILQDVTIGNLKMSIQTMPLSVRIVCELLFVNHLARDKLSRVLPAGMELSQFLVLLHIAQLDEETGPAKLADAFNVTRGAMSNTLGRLERHGLITVRPDPLDARRKFIGLSAEGKATLDEVFGGIRPAFEPILGSKEPTVLDTSLTLLAEIREGLETRR